MYLTYTPHAATDQDLQRSNPPRSKRDPRWQYAYDPFTIWGRRGPDLRCNSSAYTDTLSGSNREKYDYLANKIYHRANCPIFNDFHCRGDLIEEFLKAWYSNPEIKLLRVVEYCNSSTGYPTWRMDWVAPKTKLPSWLPSFRNYSGFNR